MSRLELYTDLASRGGTRLSTGGFVRNVTTMRSLRSVDPSTTEAITWTMPRSAESAGVIAEGQCARLWKSDTDWDEGIVGAYTITRGVGGAVSVTAPAPWTSLAYLGLVTPPGVNPLDGLPIYEFQVSGTPQSLIESHITNRDPADALAARLTWLGSGTYDVTTEISLSVSFWTVLQFINGVIDALANARVLAERTFTRNGSTNYLVGIRAVTA